MDAAMKTILTLMILFWAVGAAGEEQATNTTLGPREHALIESAYQGQLERVQGLLAKGARVDAADETGRTALMWAALRGHTPVVEFLHGKGGNVNSKDSDNQTALMYACQASHPQTVKFLLENGAEVNVQSGKQRWTPLMVAAMSGSLESARLLLAHGADAGLEDVHGIAAEQLAREYKHPDIAELLQTSASPPASPE
jgi:ankyrin repeat protein